MPALSRQKACFACAESKRKCDKQLPECRRCLDRDVDCVYPVPKRRRRDRSGMAASVDRVKGLTTPQDDHYGDAIGFDFGDWVPADEDGIQLNLADTFQGEAIPFEYIQPQPPQLPVIPALGNKTPSDNGSSELPVPWFLQEETWRMQPPTGGDGEGCATSSQLESFVAAVRQMLYDWIRDGHNSFIHKRLYKHGLPSCLQDAFTTLAAYMTCSPATKDLVMQIAEDRLASLAYRNLTAGNGGLVDILDRLAYVQALYVYMFILLFDGAIWRRVAAEKRLPTLRGWVLRMWETVKQYRGDDTLSGTQSLSGPPSEFNGEYSANKELWRAWIVTESARRTHLVVDSVANVYDIMVEGSTTCGGGVMVTARRGLWDADSAVVWSELCSSHAHIPLMVPSLQPEPYMSGFAAEDFDDFVTLFWTFLVGADKIKYWIDRSQAAPPSRA